MKRHEAGPKPSDTASRLAAQVASHVSTSTRVHADIHVGTATFTSITALVEHVFQMGFRAAENHYDMGADLSFRKLAEANGTRVERWHGLDDWSPLEWAGAACGEFGEMANFAKKLKRVQHEIANNDKRMFGLEVPKEQLVDVYRQGVLKEYADGVIYGVLLCLAVGAQPKDIGKIITGVFNAKSEEYGFPERL